MRFIEHLKLSLDLFGIGKGVERKYERVRDGPDKFAGDFGYHFERLEFRW